MEKKNDKVIAIIVGICLLVLLIITSIATSGSGKKEKAESSATSTSQTVSSSSTSSSEDDDDYSYSSSSYSDNSSSELNTAEYETPDFNTWNHDKLEKDKNIQITGTVLQIQKSSDIYYIRVALNDDYDKVVMVEIHEYMYDDVIAEDDNVTIYGISKGRTSYTSTLGKEVTLPLMYGHYYTINNYGE